MRKRVAERIRYFIFDVLYALHFHPSVKLNIGIGKIELNVSKKVWQAFDRWYDFDGLLAWRNGYRIKSRDRWHTYFDISMGRWVSSSEDIKKYENKTGYKYLKPDELEAMSKAGQKKHQEALDKRIREKVEYAAKQVAQGRSYIREQREMLERQRRNK